MNPLEELRGLLGEKVITDVDELDRLGTDRSQVPAPGRPLVAVAATCTEDVSTALSWANRYAIPVTVRGGGSGVSGGALGYEGGLVLCLAGMNRIIDIDEAARLAVVEAGVINTDLDSAARQHGFFFAPDPASAAISTVGGNIATDAGGLRCLAYGTTADAVAALTVVLADGTVIHTGSRTVKNATGLNLTQLFVGSEGTLGVITEATVWLTPVPGGETHSFLAAFDSLDDAGQAVVEMVGTGVKLEALELIDDRVAAAVATDTGQALPLPGAALIMGVARGDGAQETVTRAAQISQDHGATETERASGDDLLLARREALPALERRGRWALGDVGVPVPQLPAIIEKIKEIESLTGTSVRIIAHAGDGNLHPMVEVIDGDHAGAQAVIDQVTHAAVELGGVISGEHGVGLVKHHVLELVFDPGALRVQRAIKKALDPGDILTPGRVL